MEGQRRATRAARGRSRGRRRSATDHRRRRHHRPATAVEAGAAGVAPAQRHAGARVQVLREARVVGAGVGPTAARRERRGRPAERPLGGDVQAVGREGVDAPRLTSRRVVMATGAISG